MTRSVFKSLGDRDARWLLLAIVIAIVLRLPGLGRLGFWIDEDLTWLAVDGIFAEGVPRLPSGAVYLRSAPYSYVVAASAWLFGASREAVTAGAWADEAVYRLPSLLFSLMTLVVVYGMVREVAGRSASLVAVFVLAISPWELQYAQMARMYSFLELLSAMAVYLTIRSGQEKTLGLWIANVAVIALATAIHKLGATLALFPMLLLLTLEPKRSDFAFGLSGVVGVVVGFLFEQSWGLLPGFVDRSGIDIVIEAGTASPSLTLPYLPAITFNYARVVWYDLLQTSRLAGIVTLAAMFVGLGLALRWFLRQRLNRRATLAIVCFLLGLVANQLVLALAAGLFATKLARPRAWLRWCAVVGACVVITVTAAFVGQLLAHGPASIAQRSFLRVFFAMPVPFYRMLALQFPLMFLVVSAGSLWILKRSTFPGTSQGPFLFVAMFWGALLSMGLFESPYVVHRYLLHLNPLFVAIFSITVTSLAFWIARRLETRLARATEHTQRTWFRRGWIFPIVLAALLLCIDEQGNPWQAWKATSRPYGRADLEDADSSNRFWFDYDGCGEFLARNAAPEDIVLLKDALHYYPYGARADYRISMEAGVWATDPAGRVLDWYLWIPLVRNLDEFDAVVTRAQAEGKTCWVAYTRQKPDGPAVHLPPDLLKRLDSLTEYVVHRGRDGHTVVMRFDPEDETTRGAFEEKRDG